jgi:Glycosyltransferase family 87
MNAVPAMNFTASTAPIEATTTILTAVRSTHRKVGMGTPTLRRVDPIIAGGSAWWLIPSPRATQRLGRSPWRPVVAKPRSRRYGVWPMSNPGSEPRGLLRRVSTGLLVGLVVVRVIVLALVIVDAERSPIRDPDVLRAERIASSPARPYRDFPVEYMPLETATIEVIAGDGFEATSIRLALIAFVADLAVGAAIAWGWGRRPAAMYLFLGLPLLSFMYQRFDLVSVALTVWAFAVLRRRGDRPLAGALFGVAIMVKLWPVVLLPVLLVRRAWKAAVTATAIGLLVGVAWYLVGGPRGPSQVLSFRGATGWSVESVIGNVVWIVTHRQIGPQSGAIRVGDVPEFAKVVLLLGLVASIVVVWRRAARDGRDPAGGTSLVAGMCLLVLSPLLSTQYLAWILPWAAISFEGDERERRVATLASIAIAITGLLHLSYLNESPLTSVAEKWFLLVRNVFCVWLVISWLRSGRDRETGRTERAARGRANRHRVVRGGEGV